jgi:UDP-4-amino-4,6-dideoxy-N-acetyl-beta-L-altrosamine transaminase
MKIIPYGRQNITDSDIEAVTEALKGDFLTQGPKILEFETKFSKYIGSKYSVCVSNGTAALHLSCLALNVGKGTNVITTPITFAATANCVKYCGGNVHFVDINPFTYLIDSQSIVNLIESKPQGFFSGIITVNLAGRVVNLEEINQIAKRFNLWVIEDACHSPGGYFIDKKEDKIQSGSGIYSDLSIFSFHPVKHIACGEGGMITTNNLEFYNKLLKLRTHGIVKEPVEFQNSIELAGGDSDSNLYPLWYMEMQSLGFNYRITDFQAALGISQLSRAKQGIDKRRLIALKYDNSFKNIPQIIGHSGYLEGHAYHLYIIQVADRLNLYNYLRLHNIYAQIHYFPCHLMPYYQEQGYKLGDFPISEEYYATCLSLPMFPSLENTEQEYIIETILQYYLK